MKAVIISSEDTDVRILCISFAHVIPVPIYQRCVSQHQARYVDISKIAGVLGKKVSKALLRLHAFTLSRASERLDHYVSCCKNLGEQWSITEELLVQLESFV